MGQIWPEASRTRCGLAANTIWPTQAGAHTPYPVTARGAHVVARLPAARRGGMWRWGEHWQCWSDSPGKDREVKPHWGDGVVWRRWFGPAWRRFNGRDWVVLQHTVNVGQVRRQPKWADSGGGAVKWNWRVTRVVAGTQFWWLLARMKGAKWRSARWLPCTKTEGEMGRGPGAAH
jgi:hypothetical protein